MPAEDARPQVTRVRGGRTWRIGTDAEVAWINEGTSPGRAITAAIPPTFAAYCTLEVPLDWEEHPRHQEAVTALLGEHTEHQPWWLGYLDTGASDIVFADAPMVTAYAGWRYVLVEAGPQQAATWREGAKVFTWALPELMFPADRSWLVSTLWDDEWTCIGGAAALVDGFLRHPVLGARARRAALDEDATPPGRMTR
jgi:hypothetical protein